MKSTLCRYIGESAWPVTEAGNKQPVTAKNIKIFSVLLIFDSKYSDDYSLGACLIQVGL